MGAILTDRRRRGGLLLLATLVAGTMTAVTVPAIAQDAAVGTLSGQVLDPAGEPATKFKLVFRDEAGTEYVSNPSDGSGRYSIELPSGSSYQLVAALSPKGERLDVPDLPPIPLDNGGRRLDLRIGQAAAPAGAASAGIPWVQIGAAAGATLLLILTTFDDDPNEKPASPFVPGR
jgi:hypothetical protein